MAVGCHILASLSIQFLSFYFVLIYYLFIFLFFFKVCFFVCCCFCFSFFFVNHPVVYWAAILPLPCSTHSIITGNNNNINSMTTAYIGYKEERGKNIVDLRDNNKLSNLLACCIAACARYIDAHTHVILQCVQHTRCTQHYQLQPLFLMGII